LPQLIGPQTRSGNRLLAVLHGHLASLEVPRDSDTPLPHPNLVKI